MRELVIRDVKKQFLESAFHYLIINGLENTSIRDLSKHTGMSTGSLYYWFESKDDVYINTVKYGLEKVSANLFRFAFENIHDLKLFFDTAITEIDKYICELRLIYQVATSPVYGARIREAANCLQAAYEEYISRLATSLQTPPQVITPHVFMFISILLDYVVWQDRNTTFMLLKKLYISMQEDIQKKNISDAINF